MKRISNRATIGTLNDFRRRRHMKGVDIDRIHFLRDTETMDRGGRGGGKRKGTRNGFTQYKPREWFDQE